MSQNFRMRSFLYGLLSVLILFLIWLIVFAVFTSRQEFQLVSRDYYQQELRYQDRIDRLRAARELSVEFQWKYHPGRGLELTFPAGLSGRSGSGDIQLYRPSDSARDRHYPFRPDSNGVQWLPETDLIRGRWILKISVAADSREIYLEEPVFIEK